MNAPVAARRPSPPPGGDPVYQPGADCQRCLRAGLPVLLVTASVVDRSHAGALAQAGHRHPPALDPGFSALPRQATALLTRLLPAGFVHVFYARRGVWDIWQSFDDGTLKKLLEHCSAAHYAALRDGMRPDAAGSVCQRGAANLPAGLLTLQGAGTQPEVWIGFSRHLWAPRVLADMAADRHGARARLMRRLAVQAWLDGGTAPGEGCLPLTPANLAAHVAEFHPELPPGGARFNPLVRACADATVGLELSRLGQAQAMADAVRRVEHTAGPKAAHKALIVCLPDPIGQAAEHNQLRNALMERFVLFKQRHAREHTIAELIGAFKATVQARAGQQAGERFDDVEARRAEFQRLHPPSPRLTHGPDGRLHAPPPAPAQAPAPQRRARYVRQMQHHGWSRYASHLDPGWEAFEDRYRRDHDTQAAHVAALAEDHVQALRRAEVDLAMRHLFDPARRDDGPAYEAAMALMVHGMGAAASADAWLAAQLGRRPDDPGALVWRSLFGNQQEVIAHVLAAVSSPKWDKVYSAMKKALTWPDRGKDTPAARLAGGWERVLVTAAGPLSRLLADDKSNRLLQRLWEGLAWTRAGVAVVHQQFLLPDGLRSLAHFFSYAAWHTVDLGLRLDDHHPFARQPGVTLPVPGRGEVVAATLPKPREPHQTLVHLVMVPEAIDDARALIGRASQLREVSMKEAAASLGQVRKAVNFEAKLGGISLVFELVNYHKAQAAIARADRFAESEARASLTAALLSGMNAVADINAAWVKGVYEDQWKRQLAPGSRQVYGGLKIAGGLFGGMASFLGAYWAWTHGQDKRYQSDLLMAVLYYSAASAGFISGASTIVSAGAAGFEGLGWIKAGSSSMTRARAAMLGIRAGLIGVAVALVILAFEDDELQQWLGRSVWGSRPRDQQYANLSEELRELDKWVKVK